MDAFSHSILKNETAIAEAEGSKQEFAFNTWLRFL